jgi:hypothetical protein
MKLSHGIEIQYGNESYYNCYDAIMYRRAARPIYVPLALHCMHYGYVVYVVYVYVYRVDARGHGRSGDPANLCRNAHFSHVHMTYHDACPTSSASAAGRPD